MIRINLDVMLAKRKMSLTELAEKVGITLANLSVLKTGKAKAVRFSTLDALCRALSCQPGTYWSSPRRKAMDERIDKARPVFGVREALMLPAALCLGILWQNVFTIESLANLVFGPKPGRRLVRRCSRHFSGPLCCCFWANGRAGTVTASASPPVWAC